MSYKEIDLSALEPSQTLSQISKDVSSFDNMSVQFPLIVRLIENPRYSFFGRNLLIFPGAVDSKIHDYIHIILARSFLPLDESFVIGFTMGSTGKMNDIVANTFCLIAEKLYPEAYKFGPAEKTVFRNAVDLGREVAKTDFSKLLVADLSDLTVQQARNRYLSSWSRLLNAYAWEVQGFQGRKETSRLATLLER